MFAVMRRTVSHLRSLCLLTGLIILNSCTQTADESEGESENLKDNSKSEAVSFEKELGLGLMELNLRTINYNHEDYLIFLSDSTECVVELHDQPGWNLKINYRDYRDFIHEFAGPDFASHYRFIWYEGSSADSFIAVKSVDDDRKYWVKNPGKFHLHPWKDYLPGKFVAIDSTVRFHEDINGPVTEFQRGVYYQILEFDKYWIKLAAIPRKHNGLATNPVLKTAWIKWYDEGKLKTRFLTDIDMETYFIDSSPLSN